MINGVQIIMYSSAAEKVRELLGRIAGLPAAGDDAWPVFTLPPGGLAVHPGDSAETELYLTCDDLAATMAELSARGAQFDGEPQDRGWGLLVNLVLPDGATLGLYQPTGG